jgi:hypothetical protein
MITEMKQIDPDGTCEFRSYTLAFSPDARLVHKFSAGPLTSTKPQSPAPMQDGKPIFGNTPVPDVGMGEGEKQYCSINSLCRANNVDHGFALDSLRDGTIKGDAKHNGNACWEAGDSANKASSKLAAAHFAHLAASEIRQNRKPASRPN